MGFLDFLFDPADAHKAALADLVAANATTPVSSDAPSPYGNQRFGGQTFGGATFGGNRFGEGYQPSPGALREFLKRRQEDLADPSIEPPSPYGNQRFGGQTFGGETYGGNQFGGNQFGASAPQAPAPDPAAVAALPTISPTPLFGRDTLLSNFFDDLRNDAPSIESMKAGVHPDNPEASTLSRALNAGQDPSSAIAAAKAAALPTIEPQSLLGQTASNGFDWLRDEFNKPPLPTLGPWQTTAEPNPNYQAPIGPWTTTTQSAPQQPAQPDQPPAVQAPIAAPASPQATPQAAPAPQMAPGGTPAAGGGSPFQSGFMGGLSALAHGYNQGGLLGGLSDAMGARSPLEEQQLNATYRALVSKGMDPALAQSAVLNPQLTQQAINQYFGPKQFAETGVNWMGQPVHGFVDPYKMTVTPANAGSQPGAQSTSSALVPDLGQLVKLSQSGLPKEQIIAKLNETAPMLAADVKAYLEGREITGARPQAQQQITRLLARAIDPNADDSLYDTRKAMRKDFQVEGKDGQAITQANSVISHAGEFMNAAQDMKNFSSAPGSAVENYFLGKYRELSQDPRVNKLDVMKDILTREVEKFYTASGGSAGEREEMKKIIGSMSSPQQMSAVGSQLVQAMQGKMNELGRKWHSTMGNQPMPYPVVSPESQQTINAIKNWGNGANSAAAAHPALGSASQEMIKAELQKRGAL